MAAHTLPGFVYRHKQTPLLPQVVDLFVVLESVVNRLFAALTASDVTCSSCSHDLVDTEAALNQEWPIGVDERRFVDRLLRTVVGLSLFSVVDAHCSWVDYTRLSQTPGHPIGNWTQWLQDECNQDSSGAFSRRMPVATDGSAVTQSQLRTYSRGESLIPFAAAERFVNTMPGPGAAELLLIVARMLTLACEFVAAATETPIGFDTAQLMIHSRLQHLQTKLRVALCTTTGIRLQAAARDVS